MIIYIIYCYIRKLEITQLLRNAKYLPITNQKNL